MINATEYKEARLLFLQVNNKYHRVQSIINAASILDKYGRNLESIINYDKALQLNPKFGMALGNKAISLFTYFHLVSKKSLDVLLMSKSLLEEALNNPDEIIDHGGLSAIDCFKKYYNDVSDIISSLNIKKEFNTNFQPNIMEDFCLKKSLYLNLCLNCRSCNQSVVDFIQIPFIEPIKKVPFEELTRFGGFSRVIYFL